MIIFGRKPVPEYLQFFGSTGQRASPGTLNPYVKTPAPYQNDSIGPGSYNDHRGAFEKTQTVYPVSHGAFSSTGSRFKEAKSVVVPGPGAYSDNRDLANSLSKKIVGRAGVFGSTEKKGQTYVRPDAPLIPGPGAYELPTELGEKNPATRGKVSSSFKSSAKRFATSGLGDPDVPAPGTYNPSVDKLDRKDTYMTLASKGAFGTTSGRFIGRNAAEIPGPGTYEQPSTVAISAPARGSAVTDRLPKAKRFTDESSGNASRNRVRGPGPGQYDPMDPYASLNKRTFNITIAQNDASLYANPI